MLEVTPNNSLSMGKNTNKQKHFSHPPSLNHFESPISKIQKITNYKLPFSIFFKILKTCPK